jgi:peptidoglycan/LPS O-acetylase OafA/YrhL
MRNIRLDSIRGLSALLIFAFHINGYTNPLDSVVPIALGQFVSHMYIGVDLFFILSGYSLMKFTRVYAEDSSWISYVRRRFKRVLPAYYSTSCLWLLLPMAKLILISILPLSQFSETRTLVVDFHMVERLMANFLFLQWFLPSRDWVLSGVTWTLVVEVQFYILFPVIIRYCRRLISFRAVFIVSGIAVLLELLFRNNVTAQHVYSKTILPYLSLFLVGATLAESERPGYLPSRFSFWIISFMSSALGFLLIDYRWSPLATDLKALFGSLTSICLFYLALNIKVPAMVEKSMSSFGMVSFSFYLVHLNISDRVTQLVFRFIHGAYRVTLAIGLSFISSLLVAILFYIVVEDWKNLKQRTAALVKTVLPR